MPGHLGAVGGMRDARDLDSSVTAVREVRQREVTCGGCLLHPLCLLCWKKGFLFFRLADGTTCWVDPQPPTPTTFILFVRRPDMKHGQSVCHI